MLINILNVIAWAVLFIAALPIVYTGIITLAAVRRQTPAPNNAKQLKIAIIIPAHNEALLIQDTVKHALAQSYPTDKYAVFVVADNCDDDTAYLAQASGAQVFERHDNPGKGQALEYAFNALLLDDWEAFLVIDADSTLSHNALLALNNEFATGATALQLFDTIKNPTASMRTLAMQMGMSSFNGLRPAGRTALGQSAGLFGNGFSLLRHTIEQCPYKAHSIVEDLEYHIFLLEHGHKVRLVEYASSAAQMPVTAKNASSQRERWELGRIAMIKHYAKPLYKKTLQGHRWALEALVDIIMPPASLMMLLAVVAMVLGSQLVKIASLILIATLVLHYLIASLRFGSLLGFLKVSIFVPWYIIWKTWLVLKSIIRKKKLPWIRTTRHKE